MFDVEKYDRQNFIKKHNFKNFILTLLNMFTEQVLNWTLEDNKM